MARVRVSTTVDKHLLASARQAHSGVTDAALLDEALTALLTRHRAAEIDAAYAAYAAYDEHPLAERRVGEPRGLPGGCWRVVSAFPDLR